MIPNVSFGNVNDTQLQMTPRSNILFPWIVHSCPIAVLRHMFIDIYTNGAL